MILRLIIIILIACFVFWLIKRALPALRNGKARRVLPIIMNPYAFNIIRRVVTFLIRLIIFRR